MGIGSITSTNSMSVMQMTSSDLRDQKSKNIQNDITDAQQQMQKLASKEELSADEKAHEKKKLQREISNLNTKLEQHQEELVRSHKREIMLAQLLEDREPAKEDTAEDEASEKEAAADTSVQENLPAGTQQTAQPGTVITQSVDGTVTLREVMNQTKGTDTEKTQSDETKETAATEEAAKKSEDDTKTDTVPSHKDMQAMVSADSSLQQAGRQGTVIAKIDGGIAILKGEIKQDEFRGDHPDRKQAAVEKLEKQAQQATEFQFSMLGDAIDAMKPSTEANGSITNKAQDETENTLYISGLHVQQEEQALQQGFHVAIV